MTAERAAALLAGLERSARALHALSGPPHDGRGFDDCEDRHCVAARQVLYEEPALTKPFLYLSARDGSATTLEVEVPADALLEGVAFTGTDGKVWTLGLPSGNADEYDSYHAEGRLPDLVVTRADGPSAWAAAEVVVEIVDGRPA